MQDECCKMLFNYSSHGLHSGTGVFMLAAITQDERMRNDKRSFIMPLCFVDH